MAQVKFLKAIPFSAGWKEMEATDDLTLNSFAGNGADITNLNMSNATSGILNKAFYDPDMAGYGLSFSSGVLNVALKPSSGLTEDGSGIAVDYDGTTIGITGGKLSVIPSYATKSFSTINFATGDDVVALNSSDTVNFLAGTGMSFITNATTRTITFVSSGGGGGGTYTAGSGLTEDPPYKFNIDYTFLNYWKNTQNFGDFVGPKISIYGSAGDLDNYILSVINESAATTFGVDKNGATFCSSLAVDGNVSIGLSSTNTINAQGVFISSILPSASNLRTLGDSTHRWEDIYVDDLMSDVKTVSVNNLVDKTATESISGTWSFTSHVNIGDTTADTLTVLSVIDSYLIPDATATRDLGDSTHRWKDLYLDRILGSTKTVTVNNLVDKAASESISGTWSFTGDVNIGDTSADTMTITSVIDSNILPDASNSRALGGTSNRWKDIFVDDIIDTNGNAIATTRLLAIPDAGTSKPTASSTVRGNIYVTTGGADVADVAEICLKSSTDTYSWVPLATG